MSHDHEAVELGMELMYEAVKEERDRYRKALTDLAAAVDRSDVQDWRILDARENARAALSA